MYFPSSYKIVKKDIPVRTKSESEPSFYWDIDFINKKIFIRWNHASYGIFPLNMVEVKIDNDCFTPLEEVLDYVKKELSCEKTSNQDSKKV